MLDVGNKVILHTWVDLNDVTTLAPHVEIIDSDAHEFIWTRTDCKGVGSREREERVSEWVSV